MASLTKAPLRDSRPAIAKIQHRRGNSAPFPADVYATLDAGIPLEYKRIKRQYLLRWRFRWQTFSINDRGFLMKFLSRLISQLLILSMILLPFSAHAGMIGTDQALASATNQANVDKVRDFVSRTEVVKQFEALGLTATTAQDRVNAMTQEEINRIAGKIDTLPAGADSSTGWWIAAAVVIGLIVWYMYK